MENEQRKRCSTTLIIWKCKHKWQGDSSTYTRMSTQWEEKASLRTAGESGWGCTGHVQEHIQEGGSKIRTCSDLTNQCLVNCGPKKNLSHNLILNGLPMKHFYLLHF